MTMMMTMMMTMIMMMIMMIEMFMLTLTYSKAKAIEATVVIETSPR